LLGVTTLDWVPQIDLLGLYPTLQVVAAQALAVVALVVGFRMGSSPPKPAAG
jgi:high-affinity iron transporter